MFEYFSNELNGMEFKIILSRLTPVEFNMLFNFGETFVKEICVKIADNFTNLFRLRCKCFYSDNICIKCNLSLIKAKI